MNNSQFRKLVLDTPARQSASGSGSTEPRADSAAKRDGATPSALGSRMRSSIPMTPRSITNIDFARQLAERDRQASSAPTKKFRSTAAPKGAKLPSGYTDRTQTRVGEYVVENSKAARVKALEEMMKLQQIDEETFIKLRDEILEDANLKERAGLVKGLDWKLLEKVRRGEKVDVLGEQGEDKEGVEKSGDEGEAELEDVDDEFDMLESREFSKVEKQKTEKRGEMAPPSLIPGRKRNRDQILAELKAARQAATEATKPSLGAKFKKVGASRASSRIEIDSRGREVLITVDEDGVEKRKIRRVHQVSEEGEKGSDLLMPDKDAKPLGMEVPEIPKLQEDDEDKDIDIFDDAGDDYNPLAGLDDEESESESEDGEVSEVKQTKAKFTDESIKDKPVPGSMAPPPRPDALSTSRNYFGSKKSSEAEPETTKVPALTDPTFLAAFKKASTLHPISHAPENDEEAAKEARRKKMLQHDDRDAQDMDLGFGSSRYEDEEDFEEQTKVKLSAWGGGNDEEGGGEKGDGKGKRRRGPKKRKGDANSVGDVMRVVEERRKGEGAAK